MTSNLTDAAGLLKWRYAGASNAGRVTGGFSVSWVGGEPSRVRQCLGYFKL